MANRESVPAFQPVIIGSDIGAYAIARALHEAFGVKSICLSMEPPGYSARSSIIINERVSSTRDTEALINTIKDIQSRYDEPLLLLTNNDWHSVWLANNRIGGTIAPYQEGATFRADKDYFPQHVKNVHTCPQVVLDFSRDVNATREPLHEFDYPIVAKVSAASARGVVAYPGQAKIHTLHGVGEIQSLIHSLKNAGFTDNLVIQPEIKGDDSHDYSLSAYINRKGEVATVISGRVITQDPRPSMIGNPTAIITNYAPDLEYVAQEVATGLELKGTFINLDFKVDAKSGKPYLIDINLRPGRNSYYTVAAGKSVLEAMVYDYFDVDFVNDREPVSVLYSLVPPDVLPSAIHDDILRAETLKLIEDGLVFNPLDYDVEDNPARKGDLAAMDEDWRNKTQIAYK